MKAHAKLRKFRMSARKARLVADLVRGKQVNDALDQLAYLNKRAAKPISKLVRSAVSNWHQKAEKEEVAPKPATAMYIDAIMVDQAPPLKRIRPRAQGRANRIKKHGCHINTVVSQAVIQKKKSTKAATASKLAGAQPTNPSPEKK